jgi:hypothetical protein
LFLSLAVAAKEFIICTNSILADYSSITSIIFATVKSGVFAILAPHNLNHIGGWDVFHQ